MYLHFVLLIFLFVPPISVFFITDYFIGKTDLRDGQSAQIICQHMNNKSIAYIAHGNSVLIRNRQNIQISEDGRSEVLEITNVGLMYDRGFIEMVPDKNINQTELLIHRMLNLSLEIV